MTELQYLKGFFYTAHMNTDPNTLEGYKRQYYDEGKLIYDLAMQGEIRTSQPFTRSLDADKWIDEVPKVPGYYLAVKNGSIATGVVCRIVIIDGEPLISTSLRKFDLSGCDVVRFLRLSE